MTEQKKKVGFFEKVVTGLTGKTAEQRQADALLKNQIQQKQLASYRAEQLAQAENIGKARADWEAKQQIANIGKPKPLFNIDIGEFGKQKEGFDINNVFGTGGASAFGGGTPAHQRVKGKIREMKTSVPKLFSVNEAINMDSAYGGFGGSAGISRVRGKLRKHRIKKHARKHHHKKGKIGKSSGRQSFTITMNK
jgi:hypothetical protein